MTGFVCEVDELYRSACEELDSYGEHEGKRYCVLHFPGEKKKDTFKEIVESKLNKNDYDFSGTVFPDGTSDFQERIFMENVHFRGATFTGRADFRRAQFSGEATSFYRAQFSGEKTDFSNAQFSGEGISFSEAQFSGERTDFSNAQFSGERTFFSEAQFSGKATSFYRAQFNSSEGTNFSESRFSSQVTYFREAQFIGERIDFSEAQFSGEVTAFHRAQFSGEKTFFSNAQFSGEKTFFSEAQFSAEWTYFKEAQFSGERTDFKEAQFSGEWTDFTRTTFSANATTFTRTNFSGRVTSFRQTKFDSDSTFFSGTTFASEETNFEEPSFAASIGFMRAFFTKRVIFQGTSRNPIFGPSTWVFLQGSWTEQPGLLIFNTVHLHPGWFIDVDVSKVNFTDVRWYGMPGGPKGTLDQEIESVKRRYRLVQRFPETPYNLIAEACRRLSANAEENREYPLANQFHYWSMDALRKEGWSRLGLIGTLYWALSGFGVRAARALLVLVGICAAFAGLYMLLGPDALRVSSASSIRQALEHGGQAVVYSVSTMTRLNPEPKPDPGLFQFLVAIEGILGPLQIALLALAIRRKVMR